MTKTGLLVCVARAAALLATALLIGWIGGSAFPLPLWSYSNCHRLGGSIQVKSGPGKPLSCVIPVSQY
jgi:hypothetical protein